METISISEIVDLFDPNCVEYEQGMYLKSEFDQNKNQIIPGALIEESECFINHIHILDLFESGAELDEEPFWDQDHQDFKNAMEAGHLISKLLSASLKKQFPNDKFKIYYTYYDNPIIRFHKVRSKDFEWIDKESDLIKSKEAFIYSVQ